MTTVGVVAPGAMGSALGRLWAAGGARVVATVDGRSARTRDLAHGLELLDDLDAVVAASDVVCTVVPPASAVAVARAVAAAAERTGARPVVADLNAVSPTTLREVAVALDGLELVDGSISGPPPRQPGTRVYLSGPRAQLLADLPAPGLELRVVGSEIGTASAVKMCTASVYKGVNALVLQALATAAAWDVVDVVLDDLGDLQVGLGPAGAAAARLLASGASKADRYPGEMREIAQTQGAAGGTEALFLAMAELWERVARTRLGQLTPEQAAEQSDLAEVLRLLALPVGG